MLNARACGPRARAVGSWSLCDAASSRALARRWGSLFVRMVPGCVETRGPRRIGMVRPPSGARTARPRSTSWSRLGSPKRRRPSEHRSGRRTAVKNGEEEKWGSGLDRFGSQQRRPGRVPRSLGAYRYRQYTVPLCLGVRDPGIAELRSMRVV
eukprot:scaffold13667_cov68-Phaeocystis_antarctica.AAC.9